jgi:hypothetical protein
MVKAADFPDLVPVQCGEERGDDLCRTRVGAVKRLELRGRDNGDQMLVWAFVPETGPTFYVRGEGSAESHLPLNDPPPRGWCSTCKAWVSPVDEAQLVEALDKQSARPVWAYRLDRDGVHKFPPPADSSTPGPGGEAAGP